MINNVLKRIGVTMIVSLISAFSLSATSSVYLFLDKMGTGIPIKINGEEVFVMKSSDYKRVHLPMKDNPFQDDPNRYVDTYKPCKKKCVLKENGKVVISFDFIFDNKANGDKVNLAAEIQLNLSEESIHYVKICRKGFSDIQMKEISEKEANKKLKDKKWEYLPDYIEE